MDLEWDQHFGWNTDDCQQSALCLCTSHHTHLLYMYIYIYLCCFDSEISLHYQCLVENATWSVHGIYHAFLKSLPTSWMHLGNVWKVALALPPWSPPQEAGFECHRRWKVNMIVSFYQGVGAFTGSMFHVRHFNDEFYCRALFATSLLWRFGAGTAVRAKVQKEACHIVLIKEQVALICFNHVYSHESSRKT